MNKMKAIGLGKRWKDIVQVLAPQGKICNIDELDEEVDLAALFTAENRAK